MDSIVTVKGEPGRPTIGWLLFKRVVPAQFLGSIAPPIDKKKLMSVIEAVAKQQPSTFNLLTRRIAQLGFNSAAAAGGITATVDELVYNRAKADRLLKGLADKIHTGKTLVEKRQLAEKHFAEDVQKPLQEDVIAHMEKHDAGFADLVRSGATGKIDQFVQIFASPVLVRDIDGDVVPTVIRSSYGGGMTPSDFILTTPGARAGMIDRSLSTSKPGFLAKEVAASMGPIRIGERDCRTKRFIEVELSEPDVDLLDRHLAEDVAGAKRNDAVTPALLAVLRSAKVKTLKVRSPMTCEAQSPPCQMCAGRDASGELHPVGANIGLNYGQTMSERTTQLVMKKFHTGGSIGSGPDISNGFQRVQELLRAPSSVPNQGALSDVKGRVTKIVNAPQGGQYVHILSADDDTDTRQQYVGQGLKALVRPGDHVAIGDPLSEGSYLPQEIAAKKGMLAAQQYVVEQAHQAYRDAGVTMRKPVIEVVVAGSMRYVEITDAGGDPDLVPGDVLHENEFARRRKGHPGMRSKPTIPGLSKKPLVTSNDLLERLNFQRLETAMHEVPASAGFSDLTGVNSPIPGLAYGAKFRPGG
jgi:DNA-directed RNA polymerase subunit beta'